MTPTNFWFLLNHMFHEDSISTSEDIYKPNDTEKLGCYSNGDPPMECVLVSLELFQD